MTNSSKKEIFVGTGYYLVLLGNAEYRLDLNCRPHVLISFSREEEQWKIKSLDDCAARFEVRTDNLYAALQGIQTFIGSYGAEIASIILEDVIRRFATADGNCAN